MVILLAKPDAAFSPGFQTPARLRPAAAAAGHDGPGGGQSGGFRTVPLGRSQDGGGPAVGKLRRPVPEDGASIRAAAFHRSLFGRAGREHGLWRARRRTNGGVLVVAQVWGRR